VDTATRVLDGGGVEKWVEDESRLHALGDGGAPDAHQLSADAERPCERAHVAEPNPRPPESKDREGPARTQHAETTFEVGRHPA
jgi:hypothetical protein